MNKQMRFLVEYAQTEHLSFDFRSGPLEKISVFVYNGVCHKRLLLSFDLADVRLNTNNSSEFLFPIFKTKTHKVVQFVVYCMNIPSCSSYRTNDYCMLMFFVF